MRSDPPAQRIATLPDRRLSDTALPAIVNFDETPDLSSSLVPVSEIAAFLLPGRFLLGRCFGDDHLAPLIPSSGAFFLSSVPGSPDPAHPAHRQAGPTSNARTPAVSTLARRMHRIACRPGERP